MTIFLAVFGLAIVGLVFTGMAFIRRGGATTDVHAVGHEPDGSNLSPVRSRA